MCARAQRNGRERDRTVSRKRRAYVWAGSNEGATLYGSGQPTRPASPACVPFARWAAWPRQSGRPARCPRGLRARRLVAGARRLWRKVGRRRPTRRKVRGWRVAQPLASYAQPSPRRRHLRAQYVQRRDILRVLAPQVRIRRDAQLAVAHTSSETSWRGLQRRLGGGSGKAVDFTGRWRAGGRPSGLRRLLVLKYSVSRALRWGAGEACAGPRLLCPGANRTVKEPMLVFGVGKFGRSHALWAHSYTEGVAVRHSPAATLRNSSVGSLRPRYFDYLHERTGKFRPRARVCLEHSPQVHIFLGVHPRAWL